MRTPRVYFDICALKRGWDDQTQARVRLETEAVDLLLQLVRLRRLAFLRSNVQEIENATNKRRDRLVAVQELLASHPAGVIEDDLLEARARWLAGMGLGPMDAAHLAAAELLEADALITTDDRFMQWVGRHSRRTRAVGPVEYMMEVL